MIFIGLALVHFQKYWLLRVIFNQWLKLGLGLDLIAENQILKVIKYVYLLNGNHYNVDNGNIVDGPSNPFGFIEMSPGFSNTQANLKGINN